MPPRPLTSSATPVAGPDALVGDDRFQHHVHQLVRRLKLCPLNTLFAVDAEAKLDLVLAKSKTSGASGGHSAGAQRDAHGADRRSRLSCGVGHVLQGRACLGQRAGHFVHQHRAGNPAASRRLDGSAQRHVVRHHDDLGRDAGRARHLRRKAEVQPVAGVVLDDQHHASRTGRGLDRGEHGVNGGRGEHIADDRRVQHAGADIAGVRRLVPRAAAGDHRDLPLRWLRDLGADHDILAVEQRDAERCVGQTFEHLAHHAARVVHQLLQRTIPSGLFMRLPAVVVAMAPNPAPAARRMRISSVIKSNSRSNAPEDSMPHTSRSRCRARAVGPTAQERGEDTEQRERRIGQAGGSAMWRGKWQ